MFAEKFKHINKVYIFGLIYSAPSSELMLDGLKTFQGPGPTASHAELWQSSETVVILNHLKN